MNYTLRVLPRADVRAVAPSASGRLLKYALRALDMECIEFSTERETWVLAFDDADAGRVQRWSGTRRRSDWPSSSCSPALRTHTLADARRGGSSGRYASPALARGMATGAVGKWRRLKWQTPKSD